MTDVASEVTGELVPSTDAVLPEPRGLPPSALEILTRSELDTQMVAARRYPRSIALFRQNVTAMIRQDVETAEACYYVLSRRKADGTLATIDGPSIRLAELVMSAWGNMRSGGRILAVTETEVVGQGFACDLQTNTSTVREFKRRIVRTDGRRFSDDMVTVTGNAAVAIAERNAIFRVIPRAMIDPLVAVAKKVVAGSLKTLAESRKHALRECAALKVSSARVCALFGKAGPDDLTVEDLVDLRGILTAIAEGAQTVDDAFPPTAPAQAASEPASKSEQLLGQMQARRRPPTAQQASGRSAEPETTAEPSTPPEASEPPKA
jgi:hypothetical protein